MVGRGQFLVVGWDQASIVACIAASVFADEMALSMYRRSPTVWRHMLPSVRASGAIRSSRTGETFCPATQWTIRAQTTRLTMVNTMLVAKRQSARRYMKAIGIAVSSRAMDFG